MAKYYIWIIFRNTLISRRKFRFLSWYEEDMFFAVKWCFLEISLTRTLLGSHFDHLPTWEIRRQILSAVLGFYFRRHLVLSSSLRFHQFYSSSLARSLRSCDATPFFHCLIWNKIQACSNFFSWDGFHPATFDLIIPSFHLCVNPISTHSPSWYLENYLL